MATMHTLAATSRTTTGKGAARALRREGRVPAVIYGHHREPAALTLEAAQVARLLQATHGGGSTLFDVAVDGKAPVKALLREVQRDPVRLTEIVHVDLYEVKADEKITVKVPIHLVGTADGVRNGGGILEHPVREVTLRVFPGDIPDHVDVDVSPLGIGKSIHLSDLQIAKAEILDDLKLTVAAVVAPRVEEAAPAAEAAAAAEPEVIKKGKEEEGAEAEEK
jgi:large subunit ribosomal protein L25